MNDLEELIQKIYDNPSFYTHHGTDGYKRLKKKNIQTDTNTNDEFRVFVRIDYVLENPEEDSKTWYKTNKEFQATPELIKQQLNDNKLFVYYIGGSPLGDRSFWIGIKDPINKDFWEKKEDKITEDNIGTYWNNLSLYDRQMLLYYMRGGKKGVTKKLYDRKYEMFSESEKSTMIYSSILNKINKFNNETISLSGLNKDILSLKKKLKKKNTLFNIKKNRRQEKGYGTYTEARYGFVDYYFLTIIFNDFEIINCWINNLGDFSISISKIEKLENDEYKLDSNNWDISFRNKLFSSESLSYELNFRVLKYITYIEKNYPNFFKQFSKY
jgi:hypothetical protein